MGVAYEGGAWLVIALGLCGRGLWRGRGLLDMDYMSVACDWAWTVWAWLMEGAWLMIRQGWCGRGL